MLHVPTEQQRADEVQQRFIEAMTAAEAPAGSYRLTLTPLPGHNAGFVLEVTRNGSPPFRHEVGDIPLDATLTEIALEAVRQLELAS